MLTTSDLLAMDNDSLYEVYVAALKDRDLPMINTVRSVVADKFTIKALESSPIDNWRDNKDIVRFFSLK